MADETLRADLAAPSGSSLVGWQQSGAGAAARTVEAKLRDHIDVMDFVDPANYAAVLAGTVDASGAISAALDEALQRGRAEVVFPAGRFMLATPVSKNLSGQKSVALRGAGSGLTQLIVPATNVSGDGLSFSIAPGNWWLNNTPSCSLRISNLSIVTRKSFVGTGLKINGGSAQGRPPAPIQLHLVEIRGDSSFNESFAVALHLQDSSSVQVDACRFFCGGPGQTPGSNVIGVRIEANPLQTPRTDPTILCFSNCEWTWGHTAVSIGSYVEGVYFSNCTILQTMVGVDWRSTTGESGLHWIGGHLNCTRQDFLIERGFDWVIQGALLFGAKQNDTACIDVTASNRFTITGCTIVGQGGTASNTACIAIKSAAAGNARAAHVSGNALTGAVTGIVVDAASNNVRVGDNAYSGVQKRYDVQGATNTVAARIFATNLVHEFADSEISGATATISVAIPEGFFLSRPSVVIASAEGSSSKLIAYPLQSHPETDQTKVLVMIWQPSGLPLTPGGRVRLHIAAWE